MASSSLSCLASASAAPTAADTPLALSVFNFCMVVLDSESIGYSNNQMSCLMTKPIKWSVLLIATCIVNKLYKGK